MKQDYQLKREHEFRKQDDGKWQRRHAGGGSWKTLHVEYGDLSKRQEQQLRRTRGKVAGNGQAATACNTWSWR